MLHPRFLSSAISNSINMNYWAPKYAIKNQQNSEKPHCVKLDTLLHETHSKVVLRYKRLDMWHIKQNNTSNVALSLIQPKKQGNKKRRLDVGGGGWTKLERTGRQYRGLKTLPTCTTANNLGHLLYFKIAKHGSNIPWKFSLELSD